jgi:hypothetical protein
MSRIGYSEEEDYPGQFELWQANCRRSLNGRAGQAVLRRLEAALLALPEKRLIADALQDAEGDVCALGAIARHEGVPMPRDEFADEEVYGTEDMEEFGEKCLSMPPLVAWKIVCLNDEELSVVTLVTSEGPYRWPAEKPKEWIAITPERRYEQVLNWTRKQMKSEAGYSSI